MSLLFALAGPVSAQDAVAPAAGPDTAYIFNTLLFMISGVLVMFMAAGFDMLEAGLVRPKNISMQCLKNSASHETAAWLYKTQAGCWLSAQKLSRITVPCTTAYEEVYRFNELEFGTLFDTHKK